MAMAKRTAVPLKPLNTYDLRQMKLGADPKPKQSKVPTTEYGTTPDIFNIEIEGLENDGFEDSPLEQTTIDRINDIFTPSGLSERALYRNISYATNASNGNIKVMADSLARLGYSVKVLSSDAASGAAEGSFYALRHTYLSIQLEGEEYIVDPTFKDQFIVQEPTTRLSQLLAFLPEVAVAPRPHFLRAVTVLGMEINRCFTVKRMPLPPWRKLHSLMSKWEVKSAGKRAQPAHSFAAPAPAVPANAVAQPALKIKTQTTGDKFVVHSVPEAESPSSVLDNNAAMAGASPKSPVRYVGFHIATERHECFCCGLKGTSTKRLRVGGFKYSSNGRYKGKRLGSSAPAA